jgi:hypothetical protein
MTLQDILQGIRSLSVEDRKHLIHVLVDTLAEPAPGEEEHDLSELAGLGADIWQGVDAQSYVDEIRGG